MKEPSRMMFQRTASLHAAAGGLLIHSIVAAAASLMAFAVHAAGVVKLTEGSFTPEQGVVIVYINWGRTRKCGDYQNAQLLELTFRQIPLEDPASSHLELETPSRLKLDPKFDSYAYVVPPGEYALTNFDVRVAHSVGDVGHFIGDESNLFKEGKPSAGTFSVNAGEVVYVGHFGLDCTSQPFLWRFYPSTRSDFELLVTNLRESYPVLKDVPVTLRLFSTEMLGTPFALEDPTVK